MEDNINSNKNTKYLIGAGIVVVSLAIIFLVGSAKNSVVSTQNQTASIVNSVQPTSASASNGTIAKKVSTLSTVTNSTVDLLSGVVSLDTMNAIEIAQTEATVKAIIATVPNLDKIKVAELNKLLASPTINIDAKTTRAKVAVTRILFLLALTNNPKLPNKVLSDIASKIQLPFDAALYNSQDEYDSYVKYADNEIAKYIKINNIDKTTNFVGRVSTNGKKIPGHIFTVPNKYIKNTNINGEKGHFLTGNISLGMDTGFLISEGDAGGYDNNKKWIWPSHFDTDGMFGDCWHCTWTTHVEPGETTPTHWTKVNCDSAK
ncbi:MAG: hypothetical protein NTZ44_01765 [Candidatus Nomurabacteria bacterium]|nr:hypothetical protein [Candidatus Nomurabacteria bacterium]